MKKSQLRKIYLERRKNLNSAETDQLSKTIADLFFDNFDLNTVQFLHCFIPIEKFKEINTQLIVNKILKDHQQIQILAPRVNFQSGEIENIKFTAETELKRNIWQIKEPVNSEKIETVEIDMFLIPLLCFDKKGFRVGYGKGFYDKLLRNSRSKSLKIGLSYFEATENITDVESFDVRLDFCVTPEKIWKF